MKRKSLCQAAFPCRAAISRFCGTAPIRRRQQPGKSPTPLSLPGCAGGPMYIPHVSREPLFLNRAPSRDPSREDISFICVPIRLMDQAVGALSVDRLLADAPPWRTGAPAFDHCLASGDTALETQGRMSEDARPCLWPEGFVGNSGIMQKVYAGLARWSFRGNGFFAGESGTGKEPAARAIQAPGT